MQQQIVDLINERGEMTFRELCCELNMFSRDEISEVRATVSAVARGVEFCSNCSGVGQERCNLGHNHDCEDCEGSGESPNGKEIAIEIEWPEAMISSSMIRVNPLGVH